MLVKTDESTRDESLSQPSETHNKKFKVAVTNLTGYNGFFKFYSSNIKLNFKSVFEGADFNVSTVYPGALELAN